MALPTPDASIRIVAALLGGCVAVGVSIKRIFLLRDVLPLVLALVIIVHLFLCAKRCKDAGISKWWVLVPLYNPIVLMIKKRNEEVPV